MKIKTVGTKLTIAICGMIVASVLVIILSTLTLSQNHSNTIMQEKSSSSLGVLKYELNSQIDRLSSIYKNMESSGVLSNAMMAGTLEEIEIDWANRSGSANDFMSVAKKDGTVVWSTQSFTFTNFDYAQALDGMIRTGIVLAPDGKLTLQYITPIQMYGTIVGTAVVGMDLVETDYLDEIKTLTGAEVTIFNGTTRYATTVINKDGSRAVGTEMSAAVAAKVIEKGVQYQGTADILGQKHFVDYEPMMDTNGNIVGAYFAGFSSQDSDQSFLVMVLISLGVAAAAAIITAVILFILIRNMITKPIAIAEDLANNMSAGNLNVPDAKFKFADDEIGRFVKNLEATKHTLNDYIEDISNILSGMAEGDFSGKPSVQYIGEFVEIERSFEKINSTLHGVITNMNASADDVMTGANQIADGSQILAEGTTRQATAIDELSASIDNISEKIQNTAENAEQANKLSEQSRDKISEQNREMGAMLSAMEEIRNKSVEISDIIKTIDDIAFQTNILALNAAIEAARAGAAGKGFAVVADEVRNLAAKSAEAASHTNDLISATVDAVTNGVEIAQHTAETMKEVMDYSAKTDVLIGEITSAAAEQAEAVRQVTIGIGQISDVVQQNSATAEQTAASCEELSGQSRMLKEQVETLKA